MNEHWTWSVLSRLAYARGLVSELKIESVNASVWIGCEGDDGYFRLGWYLKDSELQGHYLDQIDPVEWDMSDHENLVWVLERLGDSDLVLRGVLGSPVFRVWQLELGGVPIAGSLTKPRGGWDIEVLLLSSRRGEL